MEAGCPKSDTLPEASSDADVRATLRAFVGDGVRIPFYNKLFGCPADFYAERFAKFDLGETDRFKLTWNFAAFFGSFWWALYRKLYVPAAILFAVMFFAPQLIAFISMICFAMAANFLYYRRARVRIAELRQSLGDSGRPLMEAAAKAGGVHPGVLYGAVAFTVCGILFGFFFALSEPRLMQ